MTNVIVSIQTLLSGLQSELNRAIGMAALDKVDSQEIMDISVLKEMLATVKKLANSASDISINPKEKIKELQDEVDSLKKQLKEKENSWIQDLLEERKKDMTPIPWINPYQPNPITPWTDKKWDEHVNFPPLVTASNNYDLVSLSTSTAFSNENNTPVN